MKKLLMLGGSYSQVPAIKKARELGYYVVTCDYLPDNPGHRYANEYINVSTTDKKAVLKAAWEKKIDGIIAYASDPSAETAAYVTDHMHLYGADLRSTQILAEKDLFRKFQKENNFNYPAFVCISENEDFNNLSEDIPVPCMVKPVDSSGSKGISKVEVREHLYEAYQYALKFSRNKRVIFESYIETKQFQLHGDGVVYDKKLVFLELGDQRFFNSVPIGSSCPSMAAQNIKEMVWKEVEGLIEKIGFESGGINVEARIGKQDEIYIMEIGPRTGGNYIPQLMEYSTGYEEMTAVLKVASGDFAAGSYKRTGTKYCFQYIVGSRENGIFKEIWIAPCIAGHIKELYVHKSEGSRVENYRDSSGVIGVIIFLFETRRQMEQVINNIEKYVTVIVKKGEI